MKDINDRNISFFSPHPYFIAGFFGPQQLLQLAWLYRLWKLDPKKPAERGELDTIVDYVPYYALGNLCIASMYLLCASAKSKGTQKLTMPIAWMIFWNSERLDISQAFVTVNTFAQLFYLIARLQPMNTSSTSSVLTHVVAKTFAGIGVLDFLHNGAAAFLRGEPATSAVRVLTGVGFGAASAASDWIFGSCLVYDLIALAVGQSGSWRTLLSAYAVGSAGIVVAKNIAW